MSRLARQHMPGTARSLRDRARCGAQGTVLSGTGWSGMVHCAAVLLGLLAGGVVVAEDRIEIRTSSRLKHVPGTWSYLDVLATNPTDTAGEALVVVSFPTADGRQYARRVWLPARGERTTWLPIRIPGEVPPGRTTIPMNVMTLDAAAAGDQLSRSDDGTAFVQEDLLRVSDDGVRSATYFDRQILDDAEVVAARSGEWTTTLAVARKAVQLSTSFADLAEDFLPPWPVVFRGVDQILLAGDRITADAGGAAALRGWIRDGGRLWIALDAVRPETAAAILGDDLRLEVVDRVEVDRFTIESIAPDGGQSGPDGGAAVEDACELDRPVDLVRVVTSHPGVVARVGGWPAAIQVPYGQGEVLLTTLGPRGWLAADAEGPTRALRQLASGLLTIRGGRLDPGRLQGALETRIGATVPPRWVAGAVLGAFALVLVVAAVLLALRGRLAGLGIVVPVLGLGTALVLAGIGRSGNRDVSAQVASAEVIRLAPRTGETLTDGLAAVYDTATREIEWRGEPRQWPLPRTQPGTPAGRLLFGDDDRVAATRIPTHARSIDRIALTGVGTTRGAVARGRFGPEGLEGRLSGGELAPAEDGADPFVVAWPSPALAVTLAPDGSFTAPADAVMAADQYASAAVLSAESMWRQEVIRTLLAIPGGAVEDGDRPAARISPDADPPPLQGRPWLVYWTGATGGGAGPDGFGLGKAFELRRAALVVAELTLDHTPTGGRFRIPATFLRPQPVTGEMGRSAAFDARTGQWIRGLTRPTETLLRYQLPPQVLPCRLDSVRFEVRATAPGRVLSVAPVVDGQPGEAVRVADPAGVSVMEIPAARLRTDARGGLTFRIAIGAAERPAADEDDDTELTDTWQIDHVRLSVDGTAE